MEKTKPMIGPTSGHGHLTATWQSLSDSAASAFEQWESDLDEEAAQIEQSLIELRRHVHSHPEASGEEVETSRLLLERLNGAGLAARLYRGGIGVWADLDVGDPTPESPRIAIRADMDALRIQDAKPVAYASQNPGIAHACGHDVHSAIVLGTALVGTAIGRRAGKAVRASHCGTPSGARLRFLFQPAEETSTGARSLVEQGALDGVDAILGIHVDPEQDVGKVGIRYGVLTAYCDEVRIFVEGSGGHAARPHHTIDPIAASAYLAMALYQQLPRSVDSRDASVFTIGKIRGGEAPNVIPDRVELHGTLRTTDAATRQTLIRRLQHIVEGVEHITGASIQINLDRPLEGVRNDPAVTSCLEDASARVVGGQNISYINRPSMGGEDFSVYLESRPGALLRLGCAKQAPSDTPFLHSPHFDVDERVLLLGVRILLRGAMLLSMRWPCIEASPQSASENEKSKP